MNEELNTLRSKYVSAVINGREVADKVELIGNVFGNPQDVYGRNVIVYNFTVSASLMICDSVECYNSSYKDYQHHVIILFYSDNILVMREGYRKIGERKDWDDIILDTEQLFIPGAWQEIVDDWYEKAKVAQVNKEHKKDAVLIRQYRKLLGEA